MANQQGHRRIMSGKLPMNILQQKLTSGLLAKYPNLTRINEDSNDVDNE